MRRGILVFAIQIRIADIVAFYIIHTPVCIHLNDRIIILLRSENVFTYAVHIRIPPADRRRIRNLICRYIRSPYRKMTMGCDSWNTTHDMDSEFQAQTMYLIGQRCKSSAICRRRKTLHIRLQSSIVVHLHLSKRNILILFPHGTSAFCIPLNICHNIFPACVF